MNCKMIQPLLSGYIDNTLSARDTWEVDGHLVGCNACARVLNEMRRTVEFLSASERFEVSESFTSALQARLLSVEPAPARSAWVETVRAAFRPRILPAWGAAAGMCALAGLMFVSRSPAPRQPARAVAPPQPAGVQRAANQSVLLSASDPFADVAAANLTAHVSGDASSEPDTAY